MSYQKLLLLSSFLITGITSHNVHGALPNNPNQCATQCNERNCQANSKLAGNCAIWCNGLAPFKDRLNACLKYVSDPHLLITPIAPIAPTATPTSTVLTTFPALPTSAELAKLPLIEHLKAIEKKNEELARIKDTRGLAITALNLQIKTQLETIVAKQTQVDALTAREATLIADARKSITDHTAAMATKQTIIDTQQAEIARLLTLSSSGTASTSTTSTTPLPADTIDKIAKLETTVAAQLTQITNLQAQILALSSAAAPSSTGPVASAPIPSTARSGSVTSAHFIKTLQKKDREIAQLKAKFKVAETSTTIEIEKKLNAVAIEQEKIDETKLNKLKLPADTPKQIVDNQKEIDTKTDLINQELERLLTLLTSNGVTGSSSASPSLALPTETLNKINALETETLKHLTEIAKLQKENLDLKKNAGAQPGSGGGSSGTQPGSENGVVDTQTHSNNHSHDQIINNLTAEIARLKALLAAGGSSNAPESEELKKKIARIKADPTSLVVKSNSGGRSDLLKLLDEIAEQRNKMAVLEMLEFLHSKMLDSNASEDQRKNIDGIYNALDKIDFFSKVMQEDSDAQSLIAINNLFKEAAKYSDEEKKVKDMIKGQIKTTVNPAYLLLLVDTDRLFSVPAANHARILKLIKALTEPQRKYLLCKISNNNSNTALTAIKNPSTLVQKMIASLYDITKKTSGEPTPEQKRDRAVTSFIAPKNIDDKSTHLETIKLLIELMNQKNINLVEDLDHSQKVLEQKQQERVSNNRKKLEGFGYRKVQIDLILKTMKDRAITDLPEAQKVSGMGNKPRIDRQAQNLEFNKLKKQNIYSDEDIELIIDEYMIDNQLTGTDKAIDKLLSVGKIKKLTAKEVELKNDLFKGVKPETPPDGGGDDVQTYSRSNNQISFANAIRKKLLSEYNIKNSDLIIKYMKKYSDTNLKTAIFTLVKNNIISDPYGSNADNGPPLVPGNGPPLPPNGPPNAPPDGPSAPANQPGKAPIKEVFAMIKIVPLSKDEVSILKDVFKPDMKITDSNNLSIKNRDQLKDLGYTAQERTVINNFMQEKGKITARTAVNSLIKGKYKNRSVDFAPDNAEAQKRLQDLKDKT